MKIACLLTDIRCGVGPDGWEIARQARAITPELPVVYVSGDSAADHARFGVADSLMVPKPFQIEQLLRAVRTVLTQ